jgi:sulfite exporter TauE/SafE
MTGRKAMDADLLVLGSAALSGLMSAPHCSAMCGGIATGFGVRNTRAGWFEALLPNLGRMLGYAVAGAFAGGIGHGIVSIASMHSLTRAARAAVGLVLVVVALRLLDAGGRLHFLAAPGRLGARWLAPLWHRARPGERGMRRLLAGVLWGWLPCGLSSTVLFAAWLQASAVQGAATMLAFGAGTLPAMVALTWSGARVGRLLQRRGWRVTAASLVMLAGLGTLLAPWLADVPTVHRVLSALGCRSLA